MATLFEKRREFQKLILTGRLTQREIAQSVGVSEVTASRWMSEITTLRYYKIRKQMIAQLERLTVDYQANMPLVQNIITDIERIERLIIKQKYIPHLTQQ